MLAGNWKNIEELEEVLTMEELSLIVKSIRDKEYRAFKFQASLKGIDLDAEESKSRFAEIEKRAVAKASGKSVEEIEKEEERDFSDFGIDVEVIK